MSSPDINRNYFQLLEQPEGFELDVEQLGVKYRQLQQQLHPDRYTRASGQEQRLAVQYSALVNQAYNTLKQPLRRALYLLELNGLDERAVSAQKIAGGFLMEQMELREKLEDIADMVDPESMLDHLIVEIGDDIAVHLAEFARDFAAGRLEDAAAACVKTQYLEKLLTEAENIESGLLD